MEELLPEDILDEDTIEELDMDDDSDELTPEEIEKLSEDLKDENWEVKPPEEPKE